MTAPLIPARHKDVNRAKVCDDNFVEFVKGWSGAPQTVLDVRLGTTNNASDILMKRPSRRGGSGKGYATSLPSRPK